MVAALGPHASFVIASYGAAGVIALVLALWVMIDHRRQRARLAQLERATPRSPA